VIDDSLVLDVHDLGSLGNGLPGLQLQGELNSDVPRLRRPSRARRASCSKRGDTTQKTAKLEGSKVTTK